MSLILSTTSLGVVLPVLKEKRILNGAYGQYILIAALVADFLTLTMLSLVTSMMGEGFGLHLLLILLFGVAFAMTARLGKWFASVPVLREIVHNLSHATAQIQVRGSFALIVAWVVLAGALGIEIILGAFLAGIFVSVMAESGHSLLRQKLDAIGFGFFVPIFFIMVGVHFDLSALLVSRSALLLVPLLVVSAYVVKVIPSFIYRCRFSKRQALATGILLSSRLSLIIAASEIALKLEQISPAVNSAVILVAIVTSSLSPVFFNLLAPKNEDVERSGVIIVGIDPITEHLARRLARLGETVTFVEKDPQRAAKLIHDGFCVVSGAAVAKETLARAGAATASALVMGTDRSLTRLRVCELAAKEFQIPRIVARASSVRLRTRLHDLGVHVVQPALANVIALEGVLRFPTAFDVLLDTDDDVEMGDAVLRNSSMNGVRLRELHLPGNALVVSIRREKTVMVPHGETVLELNDHLALIGSHEAVVEARDLVEA